MVKAVVFDIGNVLIEWRPERHYDRIMSPEDRKALFAEVDLHAMNAEVDLGKPFRQTVYDFAERHPKWRDQIRRWHDDWIHMASPEIPQSVRLLRALRAKGIPVYALSNFGIGTFELAEMAYPFLKDFDMAFVSGYLGLAKPDPAIYACLEDKTGYSGADLLFADDRADNIAAATARGWQTYLFPLASAEGAQGFAARLVSEGLLSEAEAQ